MAPPSTKDQFSRAHHRRETVRQGQKEVCSRRVPLHLPKAKVTATPFRMTAPLVSNVAASAMLRRKLEKLLEERRTASDDEALKVGGERIELCWAGKLM